MRGVSGWRDRTAGLRWDAGHRLRVGRAVLGGVLRRLRPGGRPRIERLLFAPPDLRTADPTVAADIYSGLFVFAGRVADTRGLSPFEIEAPTRAWADALHGFGWLRHLSAADTALARDNARALVRDFIERPWPAASPACGPQTTARRLMSFLAQSSTILTGADADFYDLFIAGLEQDAKRLRARLSMNDDPAARLSALIALAMLGLSAEGVEWLEERHGRQLAAALDGQVLPDGGHVSRNPRVAIELMLDLLPLKATYAARGVDPPPGLMGAMDRIVPHLRLLRHGDGSIALFNGVGATAVDALATIFASHDVAGRTQHDAPFSGYQRLDAGDSVLIADTGAAPPFAASAEAMAGCGAFEFSHGRQKLIVNCGLPRRAPSEMPVELRGTAAHSAMQVDGASSAVFVTRRGETRIARGPRKVTAARDAATGSLSIGHDGYVAAFGVELTRTLTLDASGLALDGIDRASAAPAGGAGLMARFHLHPAVRAGQAEDGSILLSAPAGPSWRFACEGASLAVEDSMYFAGVDGARRSLQIVARLDRGALELRWRLEAVEA